MKSFFAVVASLSFLLQNKAWILTAIWYHEYGELIWVPSTLLTVWAVIFVIEMVRYDDWTI